MEETIKGIKPDTIFDGPKMSGGFYGALQSMALHMQNPELLVQIKNESQEAYTDLLTPLYVLLSDINKILIDQNLLVDIPKEEIKKEPN